MTSTKKNIDPLIVDPRAVAPDSRSAYPPPFDEIVRGRHRHRLSPVTGLKKFGVNLVRLEPGSSSSARHWHTEQDEFVYVVAGTATLVTDDGETEMGRAWPPASPPVIRMVTKWSIAVMKTFGISRSATARSAKTSSILMSIWRTP